MENYIFIPLEELEKMSTPEIKDPNEIYHTFTSQDDSPYELYHTFTSQVEIIEEEETTSVDDRNRKQSKRLVGKHFGKR